MIETLGINKSQIIDLSESLARNYENYFLTRNPFPPIGVSENLPMFTIDREEVIRKFQYAISDLRKTGASVLTMLVGQYGSGKSHLLLQFKQSVNTQLLNRDSGMLAAYVKNPGDEFRHLLVSMMDNISLQRLSELVKNFLEEIIKNDDELKLFCKPYEVGKFVDSEISIGELMDSSQFLNFSKAVHKKKFSLITNPDLLHAFLCLAHPEFSFIAWKWFLGEKLSSSEQNNTNIKTIIDNENAKKNFSDFIKTLDVIGIKYFALFLDELEKISDIHQSKMNKYHDDLRQIIDDSVKNVFFYFAITIKQWEKYTSISTALSRRLITNGIKLDEFTEEQTGQLIEKYLESARTDNFNSKDAKKRFPECDVSLCPFTKESIKILHKTTSGVVYQILQASKTALELAHDEPTKYSSVNDVILKKFKT